jgi:hypothetical protein
LDTIEFFVSKIRGRGPRAATIRVGLKGQTKKRENGKSRGKGKKEIAGRDS